MVVKYRKIIINKIKKWKESGSLYVQEPSAPFSYTVARNPNKKKGVLHPRHS